MVTTLSPNASDTPTRPIPTCGKPAAITALPHPPNVSQNVPMASAASFFVSIDALPCLDVIDVLFFLTNFDTRSSARPAQQMSWTVDPYHAKAAQSAPPLS